MKFQYIKNEHLSYYCINQLMVEWRFWYLTADLGFLFLQKNEEGIWIEAVGYMVKQRGGERVVVWGAFTAPASLYMCNEVFWACKKLLLFLVGPRGCNLVLVFFFKFVMLLHHAAWPGLLSLHMYFGFQYLSLFCLFERWLRPQSALSGILPHAMQFFKKKYIRFLIFAKLIISPRTLVQELLDQVNHKSPK